MSTVPRAPKSPKGSKIDKSVKRRSAPAKEATGRVVNLNPKMKVRQSRMGETARLQRTSRSDDYTE